MGKTLVTMTNPEIDFNTLSNLLSFCPVYHKHEDVFFIMPKKPQPATSIDWNGEFWIRVNPDTGEVLGLEIEDFESVFLKKYPVIAKVWKESRPLCLKDTKKSDNGTWNTFISILVSFISDFFKNDPKQIPLTLNS
jgi:hypothetical protein